MRYQSVWLSVIIQVRQIKDVQCVFGICMDSGMDVRQRHLADAGTNTESGPTYDDDAAGA